MGLPPPSLETPPSTQVSPVLPEGPAPAERAGVSAASDGSTPPSEATARPEAPAAKGSGRAYLGLALLGWGLSILLGVTPHEDLLVGGGLAVFGLALAASSPRLPEFRGSLSPWIVAGAGLAVVAGLLAFNAAAGAALDGPKAAILLVGAGLVAAAPLLGRRLRVGRKGRSITVASMVVGSLAVLGAPLAVWGLQAATKGVVGTTPIEAFVRFALIAPVGAFLRLVGFAPEVQGQTVTYATRDGSLALEVGAACSGVQAMALFTGVLALFLWTEKPGARRLAVWSAIGIGGVYVANLLRLVMLFLVGIPMGRRRPRRGARAPRLGLLRRLGRPLRPPRPRQARPPRRLRLTLRGCVPSPSSQGVLALARRERTGG